MLERNASIPAVLRVLRDTENLPIARRARAIVIELEDIEAAVLLAEMEDNHLGQMHKSARPAEKKAALKQYLKSGGNRRRVFDAFVAGGEFTPFEVAEATGLYEYTAAPRCTELKDRGVLEETGEMRRFNGHDPAGVLRLTSKGRGIAVAVTRNGW